MIRKYSKQAMDKWVAAWQSHPDGTQGGHCPYDMSRDLGKAQYKIDEMQIEIGKKDRENERLKVEIQNLKANGIVMADQLIKTTEKLDQAHKDLVLLFQNIDNSNN